jgi:hypothetical protein
MSPGDVLLPGDPPPGLGYTWYYCNCGHYGGWEQRKPSSCPQRKEYPHDVHKVRTGKRASEWR